MESTMSTELEIINVGSHVNPPAEIWVRDCPEELRHLAPKLIKKRFPGESSDAEALLLEGVEYRPVGMQMGLPNEPWFTPSFDDGPASNREPAARIEAQEQDGVSADVIVHPGYPIMLPKDRPTRFGMMVAFNTWLAEFCAYDPSRLIGIGEIPMWDMELAAREARRIHELGLRGARIPAVPGYEGAWSSPADHPYTSEFYEPIWRVLDELGLVLVIHPDAYAATPALQSYDQGPVNIMINKGAASEIVVSLIVSGVFERYPRLKLLNVEGGVGWLAHLVPWMDVLFEEHPHLYASLPKKPSAYYYEHVYGSFLWDSCGIANRDIIGIENIMWCNDFPHNYGPWPNSRKKIEAQLEGLSLDEKRKILSENAKALFGLES
jgi:predicted TIM-barrel fold metal-dependent hydrolase